MLSVRTVRTLKIFKLRIHISKHDTNATDLECEVNKARFYENNEYGLHWTLSSSQAESLHDERTITPATISLQGEPLACWIRCIPSTGTYHNLYAIINVATTFTAI